VNHDLVGRNYLLLAKHCPVRIAQSSVAFDPEFTSVVVLDLSHGHSPSSLLFSASGQPLQVAAEPLPNSPGQWLKRQNPVAVDRVSASLA
jgi:hypothetical protein